MAADAIQASVGMHENGTKNCYNLAEDVSTIIKLLNFSANGQGGTRDNKLSPSASPQDLFRAIKNFQQTQNDGGSTPRLSVDGHVDPRGNTLARLNQTARKIGPLNPEDSPTTGVQTVR